MIQTKNKPVILVVDDDKPSRKVIKHNLEILEYQIEEAENGKEAVEKATKGIPDLILIDLAMPVMNGLDAIKRIKENEKTLNKYSSA